VCMVKKRENIVGGTARMHNLSTRKRLEMHGVHPFAINVCTIPVFGQIFETCTGLDEYTKGLPALAATSTRSDDEKGEKIMPALDNKASMNFSTHALTISMHQPNHLRISTFLDQQKAQGAYEPYYALKSIHLSCVNDPTFVKELKVSADRMCEVLDA